ncbi:ABC transporter substrate-binding protein [Paenibacillus darwinianus]|uniref:Chorismate dehydratase n=1 Tax=Paenibacillus darwinianus TaxID=1380763 RepID=A0A9W5S3Z6_9BACL|nr:menaquinone biosynthesis protein [Paenibacillus darwinianus]EXX91320.1 ABC transporter substrate-binding protein [Paenibacillus darwinianus]EXX92162.1 ABC transporter substrate-binding protein [Paenibacillus darwinianus]EXX92496.1 ABC transporter substrate-binding protein [Paenibacillus darwinianus]
MGLDRPITVGRIDYANVWPIFDRFDEVRAECRLTGVNVVVGMPSELNGALMEGNVDMASVSSFAYGRHAEQLVLLPDLSVSADGEVRSILLFIKKPLDDVLKGTVAVTSTSATSVNLLKIILQGRFGAEPRYITMEPDLDAMLEEADAALLIGDHAIQGSWRTDHGCEVLDVGRLWKDWTGLTMTFAVIAVRKEVALRAPEKVSDIYKALLESKRRGLQEIDCMASKAAARLGGLRDYWEAYFNGLRYGFGPDERQGLTQYFRYADRLGLLERAAGLQFWSDQSVAQVKE